MKAILISDKPKWCALMMNGIKKIEVRKESVGKAVQKLIDEQGFADIYVYCTKDKEQLTSGYSSDIKGTKYFIYNDNEAIDYRGKVIFKFRCYKVEEVESRQYSIYQFPYTESLDSDDLLTKSCLLTKDFDDYLSYDKKGFAIHISDLEIFDKPKEISEFRFVRPTKIKNFYMSGYLTKAPQNMCYIEIEDSTHI